MWQLDILVTLHMLCLLGVSGARVGMSIEEGAIAGGERGWSIVRAFLFVQLAYNQPCLIVKAKLESRFAHFING